MMHKTRPHEAVRSVAQFVMKERERKVKAREITKEQAAAQEKAIEEASKVKESEESDKGSDSGYSKSVAASPSKTSPNLVALEDVASDKAEHGNYDAAHDADPVHLIESAIIV